MAAAEQAGADIDSSRRSVITLPKLGWPQILAISIFWLALNFHWAALGIIILPSQVFKLVGDVQKGEALAFVLVPGAFVSLFANPLFGLLSDSTHGWLAKWGKRRPCNTTCVMLWVRRILCHGHRLLPDRHRHRPLHSRREEVAK